MLEFRGCSFAQGTFRLDVDWSLGSGSRLAVVGPSGAGKSTLLAGVAGFVDCAGGTVFWQGQAMPARPDARPVAMLFQDHNLFPHLTAAQNVGLGLRPALRLSPDESDQVDQALEAVGLSGMGPRTPAELSGGQQSRIAIARILVMARPVILLDEPFSALGPAQRVDMLGLVSDVADRLDATLIVVTHDPDEAERLNGLVSFVDEGRAAAPVQAAEFFRDPPEGMRRYSGR